MKNLNCLLTGNSSLIHRLNDCLNEFGHHVKVNLNNDAAITEDKCDYVFFDYQENNPDLTNTSLSALLLEHNSHKLIVYLWVDYKYYILTEYNLNYNNDLNKSLEELIIFLARTEINPSILSQLTLAKIGNTKENDSISAKAGILKNDQFSNHQFNNVIAWFSQTVIDYGNKLAIICNGIQITYTELDIKSDSLAHQILAEYNSKYGISDLTDCLIGIMLERSIDVVVAMLAVLKSGAGFIPLDIDTPQSRINYIVNDASLKFIIVTDNNITTNNKESLANYLILGNQLKNNNSSNIASLSLPVITPKQLAYVIYTSGTTGQPKGVMIEHSSVNNLTLANIKNLGLTGNDRIMQFAKFTFDASIAEIFPTLICGATIYMCTNNERSDTNRLIDFLRNNQITVGTFPPALLNVIPYVELSNLRTIIVAGEACNKNTITLWAQRRNLVNAYGPTETTVCASMHIYTKGDLSTNIGKPISNTQLYVLDENLDYTAVGAIGELYIGGAGVARGYLNRPELTKERFINNPYASEDDIARGYTRLYKTGDLVRWLPDGNLEYIGRNDFQVKIRGYRIELGEIESVLYNHPDIVTSVVILNNNIGVDGSLVAYYVSKDCREIDNLRNYLNKSLPEYMIPGIFVCLEHIPLTVNGKVDRRALLDIDLSNILQKLNDQPLKEPLTQVEEFLVHIWQKLLKVNLISCNNSFFELGGHSVLIMRLLSEIRREYKCNLVPKDIYENPVLSDLAKIIEHAIAITKDAQPIKLTDEQFPMLQIKEVKIPASSMQKSLKNIHYYDNYSVKAYVTPLLFEVIGNLELSNFKLAITDLAVRHEILRTRFITCDSEVYQSRDVDGIKLEIIEGVDSNIHSWVDKQANTIFDLEHGPLFKPALYIAQDSHKQILSLTHHHIIADGYSIDILLRDLFLLYDIRQGKATALPPVTYQYGDFSVWQAKKMARTDELAKYKKYWEIRLPKNPEFTIPGDNHRPAQLTYVGEIKTFELDSEIKDKLTDYVQKHKVTEFVVLLSAFYILLAKYTGETRVNAGIPFANRHYPEVENMVGCMINTLPFEYEINGELTTLEVINEINTRILELQSVQELSSFEIAHKLPAVSGSYSSLFQLMFVMQSNLNEIRFTDLTLKNIAINNGTSKCDMGFQIQRGSDQLNICIEYNTHIYTADTVNRLFKYYLAVLNNILTHNKLIHDINLIDKSYLDKIIKLWARNDKNITIDNVVALFTQQTQLKPNTIAVVCQEQTITYGELNKLSTQLANYLIEKHRPNYIAGVLLERSIDMVIAILAILKSGGAYLPLSFDLPVERIQHMLDDTKADCIISSSNLELQLHSQQEYDIIHIDKFNYNLFSSSYTNIINNHDLAYIIYTSGSTGEPKGVMIEHKSLQNTILAIKDIYNVQENLFRISTFASFIFDVFTAELFASLVFGGELHILSNEVRTNLNLLADYLNNKKIHFCFLPPAVLDVLPRKNYPNLNTIIFAGEACNAQAGAYWATKVNLFNCYGPTETAIYATTAKITPNTNINCIGKPLFNTHVYVLDKHLNIVPPGVIGELYIGGDGLARGYLNRPDLTNEKFIKNKYATLVDIETGNTRLYKTGDLVRWMPEGEGLEYIGRNDFQIKLRGHRIELGEIEQVIASYNNIQQVAVIVDNRLGNGILVAYYVRNIESASEGSNLVNNLREFIGQKLPLYMIPSLFIELNAMPLSANGKVNRKLLQKYEINFNHLHKITEPINSLECILLGLFSEVLGVQSLGTESNFFECGGNSIQAAKLINKISAKLNKHFMISSLYQNPSVKQFAAHMNVEYNPLVNLNVPIKPANSKLFMVHTARGSAEVYFTFAQLFHNTELIGLESYNLYNNNLVTELADLVNLYVEALLKEFPAQDTYYLGGWSFGGLVGYEMAQLLTNKYAKKCVVLLFDTLSCDMFREFTQIESRHSYAIDNNYGVADKYIEHSKIVGEISENMVINSYHAPANFQVHLIKAIGKNSNQDTKLKDFIMRYRDNGWSGYCNNLKIYTIDSDHETMFNTEYLSNLHKITMEIIQGVRS